MPLGTEVGLGPGDIVLDGDWASSSPWKGAQQPAAAPTLRPTLLWQVAHISAITMSSR